MDPVTAVSVPLTDAQHELLAQTVGQYQAAQQQLAALVSIVCAGVGVKTGRFIGLGGEPGARCILLAPLDPEGEANGHAGR